MSVWFLIWLVATNAVNFAFYLAITRVRFGWVKTVAVFLAGYCLPLVIYLAVHRAHVPMDEPGMAKSFSYGFALMCTIWGLNVLAMSSGALGKRLFCIIVCGIHQVGAFAFGFLAMRRLEPAWVGGMVATLIMAGMGTAFFLLGIPRALKMDVDAGWRELNVSAGMNFILLYATGIWPVYVAGGDWRDIFQFAVANVVSLLYVPMAITFAEKNRALRLRQMLEDNTRILQADLRVARASEDGARRIRHDARHHAEVLCSLLREGRADEALRYLEHTISHELLLPPSNERWCENALVNSILKIGSQRAQARGLDFRAEARVPSVIGIDEPDLVALVSNLIENAVNGAAGGAVRVSVVEDRGALRIGVSNRVPADFKLVDGLPCERPGVGIFSVCAEVEKYRGLCDYVLEGGELTARVMVVMAGRQECRPRLRSSGSRRLFLDEPRVCDRRLCRRGDLLPAEALGQGVVRACPRSRDGAVSCEDGFTADAPHRDGSRPLRRVRDRERGDGEDG